MSTSLSRLCIHFHDRIESKSTLMLWCLLESLGSKTVQWLLQGNTNAQPAQMRPPALSRWSMSTSSLKNWKTYLCLNLRLLHLNASWLMMRHLFNGGSKEKKWSNQKGITKCEPPSTLLTFSFYL